MRPLSQLNYALDEERLDGGVRCLGGFRRGKHLILMQFHVVGELCETLQVLGQGVKEACRALTHEIVAQQLPTVLDVVM